ncbi:MAG: type II toxin-antitoxin system RelE/ParE family toxin [Oscillospiraceae bacterium]|nr:type II toxin-antitoxin system RelE/ParE family toxin [Oscillospiraceae bacterium]
MSYEVKFSPEAEKDLKTFNPAQERQIGIQIKKFAQNPLPQNEGGYGKPLGNKRGRNLTGLCKIVLKKLGIRIVYELIRTETTMVVVVVAARADEEVYDIAAARTGRGKK